MIVMKITATKKARVAKLPCVFAWGAGINVQRYTSVYINRNEVEQRRHSHAIVELHVSARCPAS